MKAGREKAWLQALAALMALAGLLLAAPAARAAGTVTYLEPPVQVRRADTGAWVRLNPGDEVRGGDAIRTGRGGRVEITVGPRRVFRVGQVSEVELPSLSEPDTGGLRARLRLLGGRLWSSLVAPLQAQEEVRVDTTTATIGVKGTRFGVDHERERETSTVQVVEGTVEARPPAEETDEPTEVPGPREVAPPQEISEDQWMLLVQQDQKLVVRPGEAPQLGPMTPEDRADPWVQFNEGRDAALEAAAAE